MSFQILVVMCLAGGIVFAALAVWLTTQKGNRISDILNSQHMQDAEAIKLEILDKIKLRSNIPIVALYIVAATVAVGLPIYVYHENRSGDSSITLVGRFENVTHGDNVYIIPQQLRVLPGGAFQIPIMYRPGSQMVNIESPPKYDPITLTIIINTEKNTMSIGYDASREEQFKVDDATKTVNLGQNLRLHASSVSPITTVLNRPSNRAPVSIDLLDIEATGTAALLPPTGGKQ